MFPKVILGALFASVAFAAPTPGSFQIHPLASSAKCLDVKDNVLANGTAVQIFDCNGTGAQKWLINDGRTKVQLAGTDFCLDAGNHPADHVPMKIWKCIGTFGQSWIYTGSLQICLTGPGTVQCLDLTNGNLTNGNPVQTLRFTPGPINRDQAWTTTRLEHQTDHIAGTNAIVDTQTMVTLATSPKPMHASSFFSFFWQML